MSLNALFAALEVFVKAKQALRREALKGCSVENQAVKRLMLSNPFLSSLFDPSEVTKVTTQAQTMLKSTMTILGFASSGKRKRRSQGRGRGSNKYRKVFPSSVVGSAPNVRSGAPQAMSRPHSAAGRGRGRGRGRRQPAGSRQQQQSN